MRIVLDTSALFSRAAVERLVEADRPVVLPSVALAERLRQLQRDGRDIERWLVALSTWGVAVEPFQEAEAVRVAGMPVLDNARWRRLARDALIAAHVRPGDELWTTNPRDFIELGVPAEQIVTI